MEATNDQRKARLILVFIGADADINIANKEKLLYQ